MKKILVFVTVLLTIVLFNSVYTNAKTSNSYIIDFAKIKTIEEAPYYYNDAIQMLRRNGIIRVVYGTGEQTIINSDNKTLINYNSEVGTLTPAEDVTTNDNIVFEIDDDFTCNTIGCFFIKENFDSIVIEFNEYSNPTEIVWNIYDNYDLLSGSKLEINLYNYLINEGILREDKINNNLKDNNGKIIATRTQTNFIISNQLSKTDNIELAINDDVRSRVYIPDNYQTFKLNFTDNNKVEQDRKVAIKSIDVLETSDNAVVMADPGSQNLEIYSDISLSKVGSFVKYEVVVVNNDTVDYDLNIANTSEYLKYELDKSVVKAGEETTVILTISYENEAPETAFVNNTLNEENKVVVKINNNTVDNPSTVDKILSYVAVIVISMIMISVLIFARHKISKMLVVMIAVLLVPFVTKASNELALTINSKVNVFNGLSYEGVPIIISNRDLKWRLEDKCIGANTKNNILPLFVYNYGEDAIDMSFEATSENSANVLVENYFTREADITIQTTTAIETDAETGDSRVVVGECTGNPEILLNLDLTKFSYNGESVTRDFLIEISEDQCMAIREILESTDTECLYRLFNQ